ncbi:Thiol-disulfide oxidoreductase ResA [Anatilimnocola aggregata]|uniref:Thiol-disulfide oxidoreductase ResA n=1 Tax=Anatilimnocola aggregata TaxID=2528021 RepID=A0A517YKX1_9BACT|nr:TlpA disulfide reductase family protein [Anatilimnocola aggregata]QDU30879.1 Thiol-disulfide oxidoreductase ResA [Anatilimnocola aggregata]
MYRNWLLLLVVALGLALSSPAVFTSQQTLANQDAAGDALPEGKDAADVVQQIQQQLFMKGLEGIDTFNKQKAAFYRKYADDPARWQLKLVEVQVAMVSGKANEATALLKEIEAAKDAPEMVKGNASAFHLQGQARDVMAGKIKLDDFGAQIESHLKKYPRVPANRQLAYILVEASAADPAQAEQRLTALANNSYLAIADLAEKKLKVVKIRKELASKPLELSFTAVDGREVDFAKLRGKVVLIDFWATWCGPCMAEVPNVVQIYKKLHDKGFEIVGVSLDSDKEKLIQVAKENEMSWPHQFDGKGWENELAQKYGVQSIPEMWLVNKKGIMRVFNRSQNLGEEVEKLLAE